jgi:hypothetical protein
LLNSEAIRLKLAAKLTQKCSSLATASIFGQTPRPSLHSEKLLVLNEDVMLVADICLQGLQYPKQDQWFHLQELRPL